MAPELIAPSEREPQMKNEKTTTDQKADKEIAQEPAKKRPAIIELTPADLEGVVGALAAGRCPPDESA